METPPAVNREFSVMTMDEIIQTTVQAILVHERGRPQPPTPEVTSPQNRMFSSAEIAALLPTFSGHKDDIEAWIRQVDAVQTTYKITDDMMKLVAIGKLTGQAKDWYFSKLELVTKPWSACKVELEHMFYSRPNKIALRKAFEARRWKKQETISDYVSDKVVMANKLVIPESELVEYIIDGLDNTTLENQARMQEFNSVAALLKAMRNISCDDRDSTTQKGTSGRGRGFPGKGANAQVTTSTLFTPSVNNPSRALRRCFNCGSTTHLLNECDRPRRARGSCFECGSVEHRVSDCPERKRKSSSTGGPTSTPPSATHLIEENKCKNDPFVIIMSLTCRDQYDTGCKFDLRTLLDTGSPISLVKARYVNVKTIAAFDSSEQFCGINGAKLVVLGVYVSKVVIHDHEYTVKFHVVPDDTMQYGALLGRDFITPAGLHLLLLNDHVSVGKTESENDTFCKDLLVIQPEAITSGEIDLNINESLSFDERQMVHATVKTFLSMPKPPEPETACEVKITLRGNPEPFYSPSRRLAHTEKIQLQTTVSDLIAQGVIKESNSEFASPIVLVRKKSGDIRLCVDFRELNKVVVKDRFPLPFIDDQLDKLRDKKFFTKLDLKNAFHHIKLAPDCTKYTSFLTPFGQYEYLRLPFGYCNSPSEFTRYITKLFKRLLDAGKICIFIDDILIATSTFEENLSILHEVLEILHKNALDLRVDKCSFMLPSTQYLGYAIDQHGISPSAEHIEALLRYPVPKNTKEVQSFLGLASYFRRFVKDFALIAKPLYDLVKKNKTFVFGAIELEAFESLIRKLCEAPVLKVYSPTAETELHCDASSKGIGSILVQKQADGLFHPVAYFSKRTTEAESRYHSYELECLAIVMSLQRFHVYLFGLKFKIITDCDSIKLALSKKTLNPRIARWALSLQNYDYTVEHRSSKRMQHVDALSRVIHNIFVLEENSFEQTLSLQQMQDSTISKIRDSLEERADPSFELVDGLVYRKGDKKLLFYVPANMEHHILKLYHDDIGHVGVDKVRELVLRSYWFPNLTQKIKVHISNCLKCIVYSPPTGKRPGFLHNIPKGDRPFEVIHVDHYGPLEQTPRKNKHVFEIIDGFSKFVKFYACKSTGANEVIKHLTRYFADYSKPTKIIADRGSCFTSKVVQDFMEENLIEFETVASGCPKANGQIERVNRDLTPLLSKITPAVNKWDTVLHDVEFALNNTFNKAINNTPSRLLFGVDQKGKIADPIRDFLEQNQEYQRDFLVSRSVAAEQNKRQQDYNKTYFDKKRKPAREYKIGDFVMVTNVDTTPGVNKKLLPKYKGPYAIKTVLENDRYVLADVDGFQITQMPFQGVFDVTRLKPWLAPCQSQDPYDLNE